jgi:hypothetical protein
VKWRSRHSEVPDFLQALAKRAGVLKLEWQPQGPTKV